MLDTLMPGTHLTTPRRGYRHHGIYCGDGRVIHYAGFDRFLQRGPDQLRALAEWCLQGVSRSAQVERHRVRFARMLIWLRVPLSGASATVPARQAA
jgi:cell wall-associated NlpC family hydrolase